MKKVIKHKKIWLSFLFALSLVVCGVLAKPIETKAANSSFPSIATLSEYKAGQDWVVFCYTDPESSEVFQYAVFFDKPTDFAVRVESNGKFLGHVIHESDTRTHSYLFNPDSGQWGFSKQDDPKTDGSGVRYGNIDCSFYGITGTGNTVFNLDADSTLLGCSGDVYCFWSDATSKLFFRATRQTLATIAPTFPLAGIMREIIGLIPLLAGLVICFLGLKKALRLLFQTLRRS